MQIGGLLIIAIFLWNQSNKKATEAETQATPQVVKESTNVQKPAAESKTKKGSNKKRRFVSCRWISLLVLPNLHIMSTAKRKTSPE